MALTKEQWNEQLAVLTRQQELPIARPNPGKESFYNGIYDRYQREDGCIVKDDNVYIHYAPSDTGLHVASTTIEKLMDYTFNTPENPRRSVDCVKQRCDLIDKNLKNGARSI